MHLVERFRLLLMIRLGERCGAFTILAVATAPLAQIVGTVASGAVLIAVAITDTGQAGVLSRAAADLTNVGPGQTRVFDGRDAQGNEQP